MFADLPQDLTRAVIEDWLEVDENALSSLDVAFCNHTMRPEWLELLSSLTVLDPPFLINRDSLPFLVWVNNRRMYLPRVFVDIGFVESLDGLDLPFSIPSTTTMKTRSGDENYHASPFGVHELFSLFPELVAIDFSYCVLSDTFLVALASMRRPLKELKLSSCGGISVTGIIALVIAAASMLEVLDCDKLNTMAVRMIARWCTQLRKISWSLTTVQLGCFLEACAANPELECIDIYSLGSQSVQPPITNTFLAQLSAACPNLVDLEVGDRNYIASLDFNVVPIIITNCRSLRRLRMLTTSIHIEQDTDGSKHCLVGGHEYDATPLISQLLSILPLPVKSYGIGGVGRHSSGWITNDILNDLVERNGHSLTTVRIDFGEESLITKKSLVHLLLHCPNLTSLRMDSLFYDYDLVDGELIEIAARHCPRLQNLALTDCAIHLSDCAVIAALRCLDANRIITIGLSGCRLITDAVLDAIDELFPAIQIVHLCDTAVTPQRALRFIVEHQRRSLKVFSASQELVDWIEIELRTQKIACMVQLECD